MFTGTWPRSRRCSAILRNGEWTPSTAWAKRIGDVWFVNVGSVGKPKDGNWHACYAILNVAADPPASFVRVLYDIATVTRAIRGSELPHEFADDLEHGGAPI